MTHQSLPVELLILDETDSTQDVAKSLANDGKPHGYAVMALAQRSGRGRLGKSWVSPPGKNLAISVILRPAIQASEAPLIGLGAATAVAETVERFGVRDVSLRWPNDVMVGDRKIAGILPEAVIRDGAAQFIIMGVGLNLNSLADDFPHNLRDTITSVVMSGGLGVSLKIAARSLVERLDAMCARVAREGVNFIIPLWTARWPRRGTRLLANGMTGVAEGLAPDGALLLRCDDGLIARISSGEAIPSPPEWSYRPLSSGEDSAAGDHKSEREISDADYTNTLRS